MQWYKGNHKVKEGSKFTSKYIELGNDEYEVLLEINVSRDGSKVEDIHVPFFRACRRKDQMILFSYLQQDFKL